MKQALLTSFATRFDYLMFGDEVVVRNYKKVIALFEVHFKDCPEEIQHILADPEFDGMKAKEQILWSTDLFETKAVQLSTLEGDERVKYQEILNKELESIKEVLITLPYDVASFLLKAITYHDESTVFCAEDKVVITEWGMRPKGEFAVHMLSLEGVRPKPPVTPVNPSSNQPMVDEEPEEVPEDTPSTDDVPMVDDANTEPEPENVDVPQEPAADENLTPEEKPESVPDGKETKGKDKKKRWWLWLLLGLLFLLILLLLMRRCGKDDTSTPLPPVEEEDLEWEGDVQIVNNRLILLFSDQKSVDEFVKAFRDRYPDKKKYQLFIPDHHLPRVELLLPADERVEMTSRLTEEFRDFDLLVIPVSVIGMDKTFTDPAFKDPKKSWYFDMIKVSNAWDYTTGNPDLIVAVIDDGFDLNHPELKNKVIVKPYNAVTHNSKIFPVPNSGHGTHVASTVVGLADNGEGSAGIAPSCKLMPIQVANKKGIMTTSSIVDGVLHAIVNGADVVNMSLGKQFSSALAALPVNVQEQAIATQFLEEEQMWKKIFNMGMSNGKDIAFVIAGGNFNILVGIDPMQRVPGTIRVSAVDPSKKKASFSNFGEYSVLSAPGVDIYNAVSGGKKYDVYSGTSMASPMVAGAFALMKSHYPSLSTDDITKLLQYTGIVSRSKVGNIINFENAFKYMETPGNGGVDDPIFKKDPEKELPNDPNTGAPIEKGPKSGDPVVIDPVTNEPAPINPKTGEPIFVDPVTGRPAPIDPETGKPIYKNPITGEPVQTDPTTGKPIYVDPKTGDPVKTDPKTGAPIFENPKTGEPIKYDPVTGDPVKKDPKTGDPIYVDPVTGRPAPINPRTKEPIYKDPITGKPVLTDPWTGKPIYEDPITGRPAPYDPVTGKPVYQDPITGNPAPVDPNTGKPIYMDPKTGRPAPVDPRTNKPIYDNPSQPVVDPCPDCTEAQREFEELQRQIEESKRRMEEWKKLHPDC